MKQYIYILFSILLFSGCRLDDKLQDNEGYLKLEMDIAESVSVVSRAGLTDEEQQTLKENSVVRIYKAGKLIFKYRSWSEVPEELSLPSGSDYSVNIRSGDEVYASFDKKYYEGNKTFEIKNGETVKVNVKCNISNTLANVAFSKAWDDYIDYAKLSIGVDVEDDNSTIDFVKGVDDGKTGYFMVPEDKSYLIYTFTGKTKSGESFDYNARIDDVKPATLYSITVEPDLGGSDLEQGGGFFELVIKETPLHTVSDVVDIYRRPFFTCKNNGENISINEPLMLVAGATSDLNFDYNGSSKLSSATLACDKFSELGVTKDKVDLFDETDLLLLQSNNILIEKSSDGGKISVNFGNKLNTLLQNQCEINFTLYAKDTYSTVATDKADMETTATFKIVVSTATVIATEIPLYEIWATKTKLYGEILDGQTPGNEVGFMYRIKDDGEWIKVPASLSGKVYTSQDITDLMPATTYEYKMYDGENISVVVKEFTTESTSQLPNNGFEDWFQSGKTWYIYKQGEQMFWDSGNEGGTTGLAALSPYNMTTKANDYSHSGYSAKLVSKKVAGVLAAGNLFIGDFIGTEDTTKGILGWGRPWNSRPKALRGYVRYVPVGVSDSRLPDGIDNGIIYIAIGDWEGASYDSSWPVVIRTKYPDTDLFNPEPGSYTGDGIIAYGEKVFTKETTGADGGMIEFEIPLDYRSNERLPKSIIIVVSASRYGDYYVGGDGSSMWLDDFELVY